MGKSTRQDKTNNRFKMLMKRPTEKQIERVAKMSFFPDKADHAECVKVFIQGAKYGLSFRALSKKELEAQRNPAYKYIIK